MSYWAAFSLAGQNEERQILINTFLMILTELETWWNLLAAKLLMLISRKYNSLNLSILPFFFLNIHYWDVLG